MEANEMELGTRDERGQALEEFHRGHHEMGGAIAVRRFELKHDLAVRSPAQAFVAQGRTCDVATQAFEFLPLMRAAPRVGMQTKPVGTDTALGLGHFWIRQAQRGIFPCQCFSGQEFMTCLLTHMTSIDILLVLRNSYRWRLYGNCHCLAKVSGRHPQGCP